MKERAVALEPLAADAQIKTFHSFGAWFLRRYAEEAGLEPNFTVYDDDDSVLGNVLDRGSRRRLGVEF